MFNINSRILLSAASIAAAGALVVGATFAYFSDSGTSNTNVFAAGTIDLQLSNGDGFTNDVTGTFGQNPMAPGTCTGGQTLTLKNAGSINSNHVDVSASNSDATMAYYLSLNSLMYGGNPVTVTDNNGNGYPDLADLEALGLQNLQPGIIAGGTTTLVMDVCLAGAAPNSLQGASDTLNLTFGLKQGPHPAGD